MKSFNTRLRRSGCYIPRFCLIAGVILILASCNRKPEPYSIIDFAGDVAVNNYSKSLFLMIFEPDSLQPTAVMSSKSDLFSLENHVFMYNASSAQKNFLFRDEDSVLYVNDKICSISIPENGNMIPWFEKNRDMDLSGLQFIRFEQEIPDNYLPWLVEIARTRPDAGLFFNRNTKQPEKLFEIFNPRVVIGLPLKQNCYDMLQKEANLETLMFSEGDTVLNDPLPFLPGLKQLFLTEIDANVDITDQFLVNNPQTERVIVQKSGNFDLVVLNPLVNFKELVIRECDTLLNFDLINKHKNLELLSVVSEDLDFDPSLISLPDLRWMTVPSAMTQTEFDSFTGSHPNLEMIEIYRNNTIGNYGQLAGLKRLYGLTVTDTVMDVSTIKNLRNLKYLSLPSDLLDDSVTRSELQKSLPDTRIVANEGFCLGSGWLLLLIPLILIIRCFDLYRQKRSGKDFIRNTF